VTAAQLTNEICGLEQAAARLEQARAAKSAELQRVLQVEAKFFSERDAEECRVALARIEQRLASTNERIKALRRLLPSDDDVASAERTARGLVDRAEQATTRFTTMWSRYLASLEASEAIARELTAVRRDAENATAQLTDLKRQFGLGNTVPEVPAPSALDAMLAVHLAAVLQDVAGGREPSQTVELYLQDARTRRRQVEGSSAA